MIWASPEGLGSRAVWERVNVGLQGETISRASAINFMADMAKQGVLNVGEATGKGGHHAVYHAAMTAQGYGAYIIKEVVEKIAENFPESKDAFIAAVEASFKMEEKK